MDSACTCTYCQQERSQFSARWRHLHIWAILSHWSLDLSLRRHKVYTFSNYASARPKHRPWRSINSIPSRTIEAGPSRPIDETASPRSGTHHAIPKQQYRIHRPDRSHSDRPRQPPPHVRQGRQPIVYARFLCPSNTELRLKYSRESTPPSLPQADELDDSRPLP